MVFNKVRTRIAAAVVAIVLFSLISVFLLIEYRVRDALQKNIEANAVSLLESVVNTSETLYAYTVVYRDSVIQRQKKELKSHTDIAFSIISDIYNRYRTGLISEKEAKRLSILYLKNIRYNDGVGYFWINDTGRPYPKMIMHPTIPSLDGEILDKEEFNVASGKEKNLFTAFVNVCLKKGEGFVAYKWPKPVTGGVTKYQPKLSFVRLFKPWGWIIGTGVYMDDLERNIETYKDMVVERLNKTLSKQKIGKSGYFFIFDRNKRMLVHPSLAGTDASALVDPHTGKPLIEEFMETVGKGKQSMEYFWDKTGDEGNYTYAKKVFIRYYKPLGWYIGSSIYKDDYERVIFRLTGAIFLIVLAFTVISVFVSIVVSKRLVSPLNRLVSQIKTMNRNGNGQVHFAVEGPEEVKILSSTLNGLLDTVRKSQDHYKNLFDNALVGIYRVTLEDGLFLEVNAKTAELIGRSPEEIVGKMTTMDLYRNPEERSEVIERLMKDGEVNGYELDMVMPDGREVTYTNSIKLYPDENYIEGIVIDISKMKLVEKEKAHLQEQLVHHGKMEAIGQLAGGVAHDFNNVLAGIMGAAELLELPGRNLDAKGRELVKMIISSASRAADLTAKLLAFGRKGKIISEGVDIHSLIQETTAILERTINRSIEIKVSLSARERTVTGDKSELHNALMNMGINASLAMNGEGVLTLRTSNVTFGKDYCSASPFEIEPGLYIDIAVEDTGCGIKRTDLDRIFEPFFTTREQGKGTGLGLAAVYGTVQDHHGALDVLSEEGKGTEFHMYLPCSKMEVTPHSEREDTIKGTGTVLLADDEEFIRVTGKNLLEELGYSVILAGNGREALDLFRFEYERIDLVILDMIMPEMSGTKAFFRMKEIDSTCKVLITSGFTDSEDMNRLKKAGLSGFIAKPFNSKELSRIIAQVLA